MDRAEATGFGLAFAGHAALLAALTLGFAAVRMPTPRHDPIEVSLVEEVALDSSSPTPNAEAPAPKMAEIEGPVEPTAAPLAEPVQMPDPLPSPSVQPQPRPTPPAPQRPAPTPTPRPAPQPAAKAAPKPAPPKPAPPRPAAKATPPAAKPGAGTPKSKSAAPTRPTGRLSGLLNGVSDAPSASRSITPPAKKGSPAVEASLVAEVRRQIKPQWQRAVPTGADADKLRTQVNIHLARDGSVTSMQVLGTTGQTASNRPQVALYQERARRAIALAAPFRLPAEFYENWKELTITLDQRLTQ